MADEKKTASILLAEDNATLGALMSRGLRAAGYHVVDTPDGNQAIKALEGARFDVVVTDIIMPDREGVETIVEIRRRWPETKIIAISGGGRINPETLLSLAASLGADRFLKKPFSLKDLLAELEALLSGP